jgi:hypothetical protein
VDPQLAEFQQIIRDRNEITTAALECAVFVFSRVREVSPHQQKPLLEFVRNLISMRQNGEDLKIPIPQDVDMSPVSDRTRSISQISI